MERNHFDGFALMYARKKMKMSRKEASILLGIHPNTLLLIESGETKLPHAFTCEKIKEIFGIEVIDNGMEME